MVRNTTQQNAREVNASNEERIRDTELQDGTTLSSEDRYYPIFQIEGTNTRAFAAGYGSGSRDRARGWADLDLQNGGGSAINGKGRFTIYADSQLDDPLFYSDKFDLADLRAATSADRTDKVLIPGQRPFAGDDRVLVLEVSPTASSAGDDVSTANSTVDVGIPFSEIRMG